MSDGWDRLLRAARAVLNEREVSPFVYAGQVGPPWRPSAAISTWARAWTASAA